jgi:TM2 domain-containing membrane protein YozV
MFVTAARKQLSTRNTAPINGNKGTVVQVTNNVPNPLHTALLLDPGPAKPKSPGVAFFLSFVLCGVGQMYNGEVGKGIAMLLGCILAWFIWLGWIIWIWSWFDAYSTAKAMNLRYQRRVIAGMIST